MPNSGNDAGRILIVDDEESVAITMQAVLEMDGYDVTAVTSGQRALELIRTDQFDLVLTDLRIGDADGMQVLAEIRQHAPETVAIMLTGFASLESAIQALRQGAYDYSVKPSDVIELRATIARGIERRRLGQQLQARVDELETANATIRDLNQGLQRRVDEATAELQELYEQAQRHVAELQELDRLKSRFLSMASHELKTPLTAISGFSQVLVRRMQRRLEAGPPSPEEWEKEQRDALERLEVLKNQVTKLVRLVDELLDVSRIEQGRVEFAFTEVDMRRLVEDVAQRMQLTTAEHRINVAAAADGPLTVMADQDHIEQVLNNLLSNAIKYSPEGGPIDVSISTQDDSVVVGVRDRGVGIPTGQLDQVFGLFYRAPEAGTRRVGGMGLGLYISKEIVTRHGGRIWAESEPGEGSTFFVAIPKAPKEPALSGAAPSAARMPS